MEQVMQVEIYTIHSDFRALTKWVGVWDCLLSQELPKNVGKNPNLALIALHHKFSEFEKEVQKNWEYQKFIAAVITIAADL